MLLAVGGSPDYDAVSARRRLGHGRMAHRRRRPSSKNLRHDGVQNPTHVAVNPPRPGDWSGPHPDGGVDAYGGVDDAGPLTNLYANLYVEHCRGLQAAPAMMP